MAVRGFERGANQAEACHACLSRTLPFCKARDDDLGHSMLHRQSSHAEKKSMEPHALSGRKGITITHRIQTALEKHPSKSRDVMPSA